MGDMLLYLVVNIKSGLERREGSGHIFLPPPGPNQGPTPSGDSSPTHPISDRMQFGNRTLRPSGKAAVAGSGSVRSFLSIPWNIPLEKADEGGRGDLGG